jgi:hypothetical protein
MLPLGVIRAAKHSRTDFTKDEQYTVMTLWSICRSPLIFGGDLPQTDAFTLSLITNDEVLAVNQTGAHGGAFAEGGDSVIWAADAPGGAKFFAVFNVGDHSALDIRVDWQALGMPSNCTLRDLWQHADVGVIRGGYTFHVAPHASGLYKLTPGK